MEKVRPWCGQPSDRGRLKNRRTEHTPSVDIGIYLYLTGLVSGRFIKSVLHESVIATCVDACVRQVWQSHKSRARQAGIDDDDHDTTLALSRLRRRRKCREDSRAASVRLHGRRTGVGQHCHSVDHHSTSPVASSLDPRGGYRWADGCRGAGTRWNAVPANVLELEWRSGKYRWPQVER